MSGLPITRLPDYPITRLPINGYRLPVTGYPGLYQWSLSMVGGLTGKLNKQPLAT